MAVASVLEITGNYHAFYMPDPLLYGSDRNIIVRDHEPRVICLSEFMDFELRKDPVKNPERLRGLDIVRIQTESSTSYSATLTRLKELGLIGRFHEKKLYAEQQMYSSARLFEMINADERLLGPAEEIRFLHDSFEYAISNYENGQCLSRA